jgi:hypothetical protein
VVWAAFGALRLLGLAFAGGALALAHDYDERIRERLPYRLQKLREAMGLRHFHPGS